MENKKAVFVSCFNAYDNRISHIINKLEEKGYTSTFVTSNFKHIQKEFYTIDRENTIQIETLSYKKNFSMKRLLSHFLFSKKAIKYVRKIEPEILYVMLPPNSLAYFASKYKKKHHTYLIFDIYDLWPETFPSKKFKKLLYTPFSIWRAFRNNNLKYADVVVTECNLFREKISNFLGDAETFTLYPLKIPQFNSYDNPRLINNDLNVCYLGSINNLIDIDNISDLLGRVNKLRTVNVHIIGDGEKRDHFIEELENKNINVIFHGKIYEDTEKQVIFDKCVLGINMMKDSVCVGLTLKSIDYMSAGLPLLNNIQGDTYKMIEAFQNGINVKQDLDETARVIADLQAKKVGKLRENTINTYSKLFSLKSFNQTIDNIFNVLEL